MELEAGVTGQALQTGSTITYFSCKNATEGSISEESTKNSPQKPTERTPCFISIHCSSMSSQLLPTDE